MKNVKPFVDLGFYVVPLNGVILRDEFGRKKVPPFKGKWSELYVDEPYDPESKNEPYALTGAFIAGDKSGAISVDCDNQDTYEMFKALDPDYAFEFISHGKVTGGGSIIYRISEDLKGIPSFKIHGVGGIELDYITGNNKLQFLPTAGNKSKVEWKSNTLKGMPELREPPKQVATYLKALHAVNEKSKEVTTKDGSVTKAAIDKHYKSLAPFCKSFLAVDKFAPELFRILTPKDGGFRELPQYVKEHTLHPDNVPDGLGNEYITKLASVLVCDDSISIDLFRKMVYKVNTMWSVPLSAEDIKRVVDYQLTRPEWVYDEDWQKKIGMILTDYGTMVTLFYDPVTRIYYAIDNRMGMSTFNSIDVVPKHLNSIVAGGRVFKTMEIYNYLDKRHTIMSAMEPFGDLPPENGSTNLCRYNLFSRAKQYDILINPEKYKDEFEGKTPETTIAFFEHLIPDAETRDYIVRFIRTKLTTLKFSEVVMYFLGIQGAGKNLFIDWLSAFTANADSTVSSSDHQLVLEVDLENFLSKYNLWIVNALFANLDEYGEKTTSITQDRQVLANIKSYTGKEQVQLRTMGTDPKPAYHKCTFILTANVNRLAPDLEDRRLVLIDSPTPLQDATFVLKFGGKSAAIKALFEEQELWAYYWATKYENLTMDEYRTPPNTAFKQDLIMRHLPPSTRLAVMVKDQDTQLLIELCEDNGLLDSLLECGAKGVVTKNLLQDLFLNMTEGTPSRKAMLDKSLRDLKLSPEKVRIGNRQPYAFNFKGLEGWSRKHRASDEGFILNRG